MSPEPLVSKPPATILALIDALKAADAFTGTLVRHGLLAKLPRQRERVYLLGTTSYTREPYSGGHLVRREAYDVRGLIEVHELGVDGPERAIARAWQLLDAVDAVLVEDPDLVTARYTGVLRVLADEVVPMADGWLARIVFRVGMSASR